MAVGFEPRIRSYVLKPDGSLELSSGEAPAISYQVLASTNIAADASQWIPVLTTEVLTNSPYVIYREPNVRSVPQRFYRLAPGP